jgi:serine/threonine protein phosphatase PrpC
VSAVLGVARAIGHKDPIFASVVPTPKIDHYPLAMLQEENAVLLLACDGLFDVASTNEVGAAVQKMLKEGATLKQITQWLVYKAVLKQSKDNISLILARSMSSNSC